jgi:adenylate cyclase class IV
VPLEIEKKYSIANHEPLLKRLEDSFKLVSFEKKTGFWWCDSYQGHTDLLSAIEPSISRKSVDTIGRIADLAVPSRDFQYVRLRLVNNSLFRITFKTKEMVGTIERNTEFEEEIEAATTDRVCDWLQGNAFIFYYNSKSTWTFHENGINYQLSTLSDLKNAFLEIETIGENEQDLLASIEEAARNFSHEGLSEELRNYAALSSVENNRSLKHMTLSAYTRQAMQFYANERNRT